MPSRFTQADLLMHLRQEGIEGVEDAGNRIDVYMDGVREDLESAAADLDAVRSRTAVSDIEDAAMLMGEAIGFAYGYRLIPGEGHHWRALRLLTIYLHVNAPNLSGNANQLELLRAYRNRVKYEGAEAPTAQTRMYYEQVSEIYEHIKGDPRRILAAP